MNERLLIIEWLQKSFSVICFCDYLITSEQMPAFAPMERKLPQVFSKDGLTTLEIKNKEDFDMCKINLLGALAIVLLGSTIMSAQASRTWVSGVGDDANPCSRTAPCKTFAGAISKTAAGGEIDALDPGGFGAVTITKAITIDGGGGQVASVLVSGTNGIVVQANSSTDVVILRNLRINGIGTGLNGIRFLSGKALFVENCDIFGFTQNGIDIATAGGKVFLT